MRRSSPPRELVPCDWTGCGLARALLLAAGSWIPGVLATVVGLPAAAFALRALHGLALHYRSDAEGRGVVAELAAA